MRRSLSSRILALALVAASGLPMLGTAAVDVVQSGTVHDVWFATSFDGANGLVVGAQGKVLSTQDGGKTWAATAVDTPLALLGAHTDAARRLAVGQSGLIFRQEGSGAWTKVDSGTEKRLFGVDANAAGLAVAVGEFGGVLVSEDGGATWRALTIDWAAFSQDGAEPHLYAVDVGADGAIVTVGEFGLVLRS
ncbi:MAG TPA: YCF48-related protein, partial [Nevskiaceae bacterium]|nr:YCF48-related protein [Nevskiaceae bacterium]